MTRRATIEMWMLSFSPLVKEDRELLLPDQPRQPVRGRDVAGRQRRQGRRVDGVHVPHGGDLLAVLVHEEHELGARVLKQALQRLPDLLELLLVENEVLGNHR
jgi:hypothetical protein